MLASNVKSSLFLLASIFAATASFAADIDAPTTERIRQIIAKHAKGVDLNHMSIGTAPISGLYEVSVPPNILYVSKDLNYLVYADILEADSNVNLTELTRGKARKQMLDAMGEKSMIVYSPKKDKRYSVTVMTDLDCGYCQKLHNEMAQYNDLGIEIRYVAFPRAGVLSPSYQKAVNVWCAKDRKKAYDEVSAGKTIAEGKCENPVADQFNFGQQIGVQGTPTLMLSDGSVLVGYYPPEKLLSELQSHLKTAKAE